MSDRPEIDRDAELVRRIAQSYRPPEPEPSARVAFRAGVDARIRRRAGRKLWLAGAATAAVAVSFALLRGSLPADAPTAPPATVAGIETGEALLALTLPTESDAEALPADYQAIEELFLEGEGV